MIDLARKRLSERAPTEHFQQGDVLRDASYNFAGRSGTFDLMYAYDLVQQLPRALQFSACQTMVGRLSAGGTLVIFDHDRHSTYGRKMGFKKFVTKYLRIELVPDYYCNARYPSLAKLGRLLAASGSVSTEILIAPDGRKRALIVRRPPETGGAH